MDDQPTARTAWRFFPLAIVGGIGITVAVNAAMIWSALATFPGKAGRDGFELSNRYNMVLQREQGQATIGWSVRASLDPKGRAMVTLTDAETRPLSNAKVTAVATRPLGAQRATDLVLTDQGGGRYLADLALDAPGQWDLSIIATASGQSLTVTRRVHMP